MELKPFDKVLVRNTSTDTWEIDFFSSMNQDRKTKEMFPYVCLTIMCKQCIPYEGNEALRGTANSPEKIWKFKYEFNWEPKPYELVLASQNRSMWRPVIFIHNEGDSFICAKFIGSNDTDYIATRAFKFIKPFNQEK